VTFKKRFTLDSIWTFRHLNHSDNIIISPMIFFTTISFQSDSSVHTYTHYTETHFLTFFLEGGGASSPMVQQVALRGADVGFEALLQLISPFTTALSLADVTLWEEDDSYRLLDLNAIVRAAPSLRILCLDALWIKDLYERVRIEREGADKEKDSPFVDRVVLPFLLAPLSRAPKTRYTKHSSKKSASLLPSISTPVCSNAPSATARSTLSSIRSVHSSSSSQIHSLPLPPPSPSNNLRRITASSNRNYVSIRNHSHMPPSSSTPSTNIPPLSNPNPLPSSPHLYNHSNPPPTPPKRLPPPSYYSLPSPFFLATPSLPPLRDLAIFGLCNCPVFVASSLSPLCAWLRTNARLEHVELRGTKNIHRTNVLVV